jgi:hypothetical protein
VVTNFKEFGCEIIFMGILGSGIKVIFNEDFDGNSISLEWRINSFIFSLTKLREHWFWHSLQEEQIEPRGS